MTTHTFQTPSGYDVPTVTAAEMRDVDRVAIEDVGLGLLQMMENAGRILAWHARDVRNGEEPVVVVAGNGGNGGGGMTCARHLANRDVPVAVFLDTDTEELDGAAAHQHAILAAMGVPVESDPESFSNAKQPTVTIDALIGYGLRGEVRPGARRFIERMNSQRGPIISLDVPSGIDATTGATKGVSVSPHRTVTLALPKTGLGSIPGTLYLADISIPATVYERLAIDYIRPFEDEDWTELLARA